MRWIVRGDEQNLVQGEMIGRRERYFQMRIVDWVEDASEERDAAGDSVAVTTPTSHGGLNHGRV